MSQFFGKAEHVAFVVPDINIAIDRMLNSGIGPVFTMDRIRVAGRYRSDTSNALITAAFFYSGSLQLEFIQQHGDTPSAYREYLEKNPQGGFHHTAYYSDNFDETLKKASANGEEFDVIQEFVGPDGTPYEIYVAAKNCDNPVLAQLMYKGPMEPFYSEMETAAANWKGENPRRDAIALLPLEMQPPTEPLA